MLFNFDNSYFRELPSCYVPWSPTRWLNPRLFYLNLGLASSLSLDVTAYDHEILATLFAGNLLPEGAEPLAQVYAGHQFGNFNPQLGDGRALILGEIINNHGCRYDICLKGAGRTPFARGGDGKAALGPMLREAILGEAMSALGVATTRALAVVTTGDNVYREYMLPGAVLTRIASSHLRVGTFEFFASRKDFEQVELLANYTIKRHYPELINTEQPYLELLIAVVKKQAALVANWMGLGFIHGVMNTDNMSIAGETIDYGPCAFMEAYNPQAVFSSIDVTGRYAYYNQPNIAQWNLARFAETLLPLLADNEADAVRLATEVITNFTQIYTNEWLKIMLLKLGLRNSNNYKDPQPTTTEITLINDWLNLLNNQKIDFTLAWHGLNTAAIGNDNQLMALFHNLTELNEWLTRWQSHCLTLDNAVSKIDANKLRAQAMRRVNPWIIPRNHQVEAAINAATVDNNPLPFQQLLAAVSNPYSDDPRLEQYATPAPATFTANYCTFCGT